MNEEARKEEAPVEEMPSEATQDGTVMEDPFTAQPDDLLATDTADPFAELLAVDPQEIDPTVALEGEPVQPVQQEAPQQEAAAPIKEDQNQYQYWQSQADKRSKELDVVLDNFGVKSVDELQAKYGDIQDIAPIARYVKSNPSVLDNVESSLSNGQTQGQALQGDQEPSLKQPDKPTKPSNYDALDAYSDPNSDSFKYRDSMDEYRDNMVDYSRAENKMLKDQMSYEKEEQKQAQESARLRNDLVNRYKMQPEEVDKFVNYMSSPESNSIDNLVTLWNTRNGATQTPEAQPRAGDSPDKTAEAMLRQREKLSMPQPVSVTPGSGQGADKSQESTVMDAMINDYTKQNPW
jgi:hypothetical protein